MPDYTFQLSLQFVVTLYRRPVPDMTYNVFGGTLHLAQSIPIVGLFLLPSRRLWNVGRTYMYVCLSVCMSVC